MEANIENIPYFEFKSDNAENCKSLERRLICGIVGQGRFVKAPEYVDEENGSFLYIPQADFQEFLTNPMTGALYMKFFVIPGFETFKIDFYKAVAGDPDWIGERNFTQAHQTNDWSSKLIKSNEPGRSK